MLTYIPLGRKKKYQEPTIELKIIINITATSKQNYLLATTTSKQNKTSKVFFLETVGLSFSSMKGYYYYNECKAITYLHLFINCFDSFLIRTKSRACRWNHIITALVLQARLQENKISVEQLSKSFLISIILICFNSRKD